jgi:hypothetical protein
MFILVFASTAALAAPLSKLDGSLKPGTAGFPEETMFRS